jgi:tetratricopeptide (TPR) repeat protein
LARSQAKIDRKALKQDALTMLMAHVEEYVRANMNLVLGILAGIAVIVLLGFLWKNDARQKATQADASLGQVVLAYMGGQLDQVVELSNALQTTSPGTAAATASKYLAGAALLRQGRFPEAEQSLRSYLESSGKMPLYENAAHGALAATLEAQGRHADAATEYQQLATRLTGNAASQAQLDAARALRAAGSLDQAKEILEKIAAEPTPASREAKLELAILAGTATARP